MGRPVQKLYFKLYLYFMRAPLLISRQPLYAKSHHRMLIATPWPQGMVISLICVVATRWQSHRWKIFSWWSRRGTASYFRMSAIFLTTVKSRCLFSRTHTHSIGCFTATAWSQKIMLASSVTVATLVPEQLMEQRGHINQPYFSPLTNSTMVDANPLEE